MPVMVVELHLRLVSTPGLPEGVYAYPWIDVIQEALAGLDLGDVEEYDDGESWHDVFADGVAAEESYIFFLTGRHEADLLSAAAQLTTLHPDPTGAFAVVTDDESTEIGSGRRVELSLLPGAGPTQAEASKRSAPIKEAPGYAELYVKLVLPEDPMSAPGTFAWIADIQTALAQHVGWNRVHESSVTEGHFADEAFPAAVFNFTADDPDEMIRVARETCSRPPALLDSYLVIFDSSGSGGRRVDLGSSRTA